MADSNKPVRVFRVRGVKLSVFENHAKDAVFHKITLVKIYREGEAWKTSSSLGRDDLPIAQLLLGKAWAEKFNQSSIKQRAKMLWPKYIKYLLS